MQLKFKKLHAAAKPPRFASVGAACFDLHADTVEGYSHIPSTIYPGAPVVCGTGLAFELPPGHAMLVFSRSGHGFNDNIRLANCVGVIDSDYRGEVKVKLTQDGVEDESPHNLIKPGDRIAQALIVQLPTVQLVEAQELSETERGTGGFGSTGA